MSSVRDSEPRVVSTGRDQVGESPVWDAASQALYWVDIEGRHVHRLECASGHQKAWDQHHVHAGERQTALNAARARLPGLTLP